MRRPEGPKRSKNQLFFYNFTFDTFRISGPTLDPTWPILDPSWAILTPSWAPLGVSWASLGVPRALLAASRGSKGPSWSPLDPSGRSLGAYLGGAVSRCRSTWCCHGPFWSSKTPSKLQFGQFSTDFGYNLCSLYRFRLILSSFAVHFVGFFKWKRSGRPGTSQGDLICRQLGKKDPLTPLNLCRPLGSIGRLLGLLGRPKGSPWWPLGVQGPLLEPLDP